MVIDKKKNVLFLVACALVTLLAYGNSAFNGFVWDDRAIIVNNLVNRNLANMFQVLFSPDIVYQGDPLSYYRPLNRLSYVIDYQLFGLNPVFYHLENIGIHLLNVMLLYRLSSALFKNAEAAFVAALIFAVHPVNAEAVNFISARNNLTSVFFVLLSLLAYQHGRKNGKKPFIYLSAALFFCGLLCKEIALMMIFVILFHQFEECHSSRWMAFKSRLVSLVPFAFFAAAYLVMRQKALSGQFGGGWGTQGTWQRLLQNIYVIPKYLSVLLFPVSLNAHYTIPKDYLAHGTWLLLSWFMLGALVFFIVKQGRPASGFGLLWLGVNFIPISNLVPIPSAAMAERYLYLPVIGLCIIAGEYCSSMVTKPSLRKPVIAGVALLVTCLGTLAYARNSVWKDDAALFTSMIKAEPDSAYGYYNLGGTFKDSGDVSQALRLWEETLAIEPRHSMALNQVGSIYFMQHSLLKAEEYYNLSVQANPGNAEAQYNLAMTLELLDKPDQALAHYEMFLKKMTPEYSGLLPAINARIMLLKEKLGQGSTRSSEDATS